MDYQFDGFMEVLAFLIGGILGGIILTGILFWIATKSVYKIYGWTKNSTLGSGLLVALLLALISFASTEALSRGFFLSLLIYIPCLGFWVVRDLRRMPADKDGNADSNVHMTIDDHRK